jgi:hypothetical protein
VTSQCTFCGRDCGPTHDHVPPKSFLAKPYRPNLRTVPACRACNSSASADEEYVLRTLVTLFTNSVWADELFAGSITRSFDRSASIETSVWDALSVEDDRPFVLLDTARIARVCSKIVRGLEFDRVGVRLREDAQFRYRFYEPAMRPAELAAAFEGSSQDLSDAPNFTASVLVAPEQELSVLWELVFFESFCAAVGVIR